MLRLPSVDFRREREPSWIELEALLAQADRRGLRGLPPSNLARLPILYRAAISSLSVARAISLDKNLVDYLESLSGRAYLTVYGTKRRLGEALADLFLRRVPAALRSLRVHLVLSALALLLGVATGFIQTDRDEGRFDTFVAPEMAQGRGPSATTAELRAALYSDEPGKVGSDQLSSFAAWLFTHNARIGIVAFALGFVAGIPTILLLFTNGLGLGAFAALYRHRGLSLDFWGWILPHGVTELGAVIVCGAAGLALADGLLFAGRHERVQNLAIKGRQAGLLVAAAVTMFFVAGLIEGVFRQRVHSVPIRYLVAAAIATGWAAVLWRSLRKGRRLR